MVLANIRTMNGWGLKTLLLPPLIEFNSLPISALAAIPYNLPLLFLTFLKIGAILYGSGYVLIAFLRADFVTRLGWLTDRPDRLLPRRLSSGRPHSSIETH